MLAEEDNIVERMLFRWNVKERVSLCCFLEAGYGEDPVLASAGTQEGSAPMVAAQSAGGRLLRFSPFFRFFFSFYGRKGLNKFIESRATPACLD
jgi:hypothetical protein